MKRCPQCNRTYADDALSFCLDDGSPLATAPDPSATVQYPPPRDEPFRGARPFYAVLIFSILLGICMDFIGVNPVRALFWTAVINGVLAPFLLVGVLIAASDRELMQGQPSSWLSRIAVGTITLVMFGAAAAMFML